MIKKIFCLPVTIVLLFITRINAAALSPSAGGSEYRPLMIVFTAAVFLLIVIVIIMFAAMNKKKKRVCGSCGAPRHPGAIFCSNCKNRL